MKLFVVVFDKIEVVAGEEINQRYDPDGNGAKEIFKNVWALRSDKTAKELQDYFRLGARPYERVLVAELKDYAARRTFLDPCQDFEDALVATVAQTAD